MNDIEIARAHLNESGLTLAVVKDGKLIYNSKERGVFPIYDAATNPQYEIEGASVADKVTGKGAALLCVYAKIACLHTRLISKSALAVLESSGIEYSADKTVDYIKNRNGDGGCPVEALTKDIDSPEESLEPIRGFLTKIGMLK